MFVSLSCWAGGCYVALWWDESLLSNEALEEVTAKRLHPGLGGRWVMWSHVNFIIELEGQLLGNWAKSWHAATAVLRASLHRCTQWLNESMFWVLFVAGWQWWFGLFLCQYSTSFSGHARKRGSFQCSSQISFLCSESKSLRLEISWVFTVKQTSVVWSLEGEVDP